MRAAPLLLGLVLAGGVGTGGCQVPTVPNPNDPRQTPEIPIDVLRGNIGSAADHVFERVGKGEISDDRGQQILREYAADLLATVRDENVAPDEAWLYGDVFRTAGRFEDAKRFYEIAVTTAIATKNEDRRVNDSIRLAELVARTGDITRAIALVRGTFDARPENKAPILVGTYLEVVPKAVGKGRDADLARLLADAIPQALDTVVDVKSDGGKAYIFARRTHLRRALELASRLAAGDSGAEAAVAAAARRVGASRTAV